MSKQARQTERSETVKGVSVADYIVDRLATGACASRGLGEIGLLGSNSCVTTRTSAWPPAAFERILDADRAWMVRAGLRLDMQNSSQERRRNSAPEGWRNSAPPPRKPRGGRSALAG